MMTTVSPGVVRASALTRGNDSTPIDGLNAPDSSALRSSILPSAPAKLARDVYPPRAVEIGEIRGASAAPAVSGPGSTAALPAPAVGGSGS